MKVKTSSVLALVSLSYFFFYRGIGTIWPYLFQHLNMARVFLLLAFLATFGWLLFFVTFFSWVERKELKSLLRPTGWAIFGSACISFLYFREVLRVFDIDFLGEIIFSSRMEQLIPFLPLLAATLILIFFIALSGQELNWGPRLKKAVKFGLGGAIASFIPPLAVAINFLLTREEQWFSALIPKGFLLVGGMIIIVISFLGQGFFLFSLTQAEEFD